MSLMKVALPKRDIDIYVEQSIYNHTVCSLVKTLDKCKYTDAEDLFCAVNVIEEERETLEEQFGISKACEDISIALAVLLSNHDDLLTQKDRENITKDYADDNYNVEHDPKEGFWRPQLALGYGFMHAA